MIRIATALSRANSVWRYWRYRRDIGSPVSIFSTTREWWTRFWFELGNIKGKS